LLFHNRSLELFRKQELLRSKLEPVLVRSKLVLEHRIRTCVHANGQTIPCEELELARNKLVLVRSKLVLLRTLVQLHKLERLHKLEQLRKLARKLVLVHSSHS